MTRTNRTRRWRKATVLALCVVYGLVLLHPTTPDAAVTPLEWVVIGTTVASFLLNAYRSGGSDVTGTVVFENRRMLKELHARFDTFGQGLEEIARDVANIPEEVRDDINQALGMYRLHEVDGLRTRIEDCAELVKNGEKCDYNLDQLWTDYVAQTAAFFEHGGLAAIDLPKLYEFERWYLLVTGNDSEVRLAQVHKNYARAVEKALTRGRFPEGFRDRREELAKHYANLRVVNNEMWDYYRDHRCDVTGESRERISPTWRDTLRGRLKTRQIEYRRAWREYEPYREVWAALAIFYAERLYKPEHGIPHIDDVVKRHIIFWERRNYDRFRSTYIRNHLTQVQWHAPVCSSKCDTHCTRNYERYLNWYSATCDRFYLVTPDKCTGFEWLSRYSKYDDCIQTCRWPEERKYDIEYPQQGGLFIYNTR